MVAWNSPESWLASQITGVSHRGLCGGFKSRWEPCSSFWVFCEVLLLLTSCNWRKGREKRRDRKTPSEHRLFRVPRNHRQAESLGSPRLLGLDSEHRRSMEGQGVKKCDAVHLRWFPPSVPLSFLGLVAKLFILLGWEWKNNSSKPRQKCFMKTYRFQSETIIWTPHWSHLWSATIYQITNKINHLFSFHQND